MPAPPVCPPAPLPEALEPAGPEPVPPESAPPCLAPELPAPSPAPPPAAPRPALPASSLAPAEPPFPQGDSSRDELELHPHTCHGSVTAKTRADAARGITVTVPASSSSRSPEHT